MNMSITGRLVAVAAALALAACTGSDTSDVRPATLYIAADASISAPLLASDNAAGGPDLFAGLAAEKAASLIAKMRLGDHVRVQFFGERRLGNLKTLDLQINHQARPAQVAGTIARVIRAIPEQGIEGQNWTHITRYLSVNTFDCAAGDHIVLITDGVESTPSFNERALLAGKAALPAPEPGMLAGCKVTIYGLGFGANGMIAQEQQEALLAAWQAWMDQAGAAFAADRLQ